MATSLSIGGDIFANATLAGFKASLKNNKHVKWTDLGLAHFLRQVKILENTGIQVGIVGPDASGPSSDGRLTIVEEAYINEFGSRSAGIPARHFVKGAITPAKANAAAKKMLESIIARGDAGAALNAAGEGFAEKMRDRLYQGRFRPNAPATVRKKGFNHPLLETSRLADAISYMLVHGKGRDKED